MKKIALINDLSGFGRCSLTASIPVVSAMGIQACPLPTAIFSAQTGFPEYYCDDYTDRMDAITSAWEQMQVHFDGIQSGYLANPQQIGKVLHFLDVFQDGQTVYLADPVLGDNGNPIKSFNNALLRGMKTLCLRAKVCTPNLTELCLLTGKSYEGLTAYRDSGDYAERIADTAHCLIRDAQQLTVLVTGIIRPHHGGLFMGNLAVAAGEHFYMETAYTQKSFSGTGDLFASVICGALVQGRPMQDAVRLAADFLQPVIEEASGAGAPGEHGVCFEKYLSILYNC